tara:strand:- start:10 stop:168 length:159 start_codon:yes stop_codon:yes gene_type:complete
MILTGKMFEDAMNQINEAFAQVNKKVDKLQDEVKALTQEKANGNAKKGQSKG